MRKRATAALPAMPNPISTPGHVGRRKQRPMARVQSSCGQSSTQQPEHEATATEAIVLPSSSRPHGKSARLGRSCCTRVTVTSGRRRDERRLSSLSRLSVATVPSTLTSTPAQCGSRSQSATARAQRGPLHLSRQALRAHGASRYMSRSSHAKSSPANLLRPRVSRLVVVGPTAASRRRRRVELPTTSPSLSRVRLSCTCTRSTCSSSAGHRTMHLATRSVLCIASTARPDSRLRAFCSRAIWSGRRSTWVSTSRRRRRLPWRESPLSSSSALPHSSAACPPADSVAPRWRARSKKISSTAAASNGPRDCLIELQLETGRASLVIDTVAAARWQPARCARSREVLLD
eukprot:scaffold59842_cov64-Phaeocystis_antarctica.AAC.7